MKKNIFIVPILSLIAGIVFLPLANYIVFWIIDITTPESEMMYIGANHAYSIFGISIIIVIAIGMILRKKSFDKMTIFKSVTILVLYALIIYIANEIYWKFAGSNTLSPGALLEIRLHYPFAIYETLRSVVLTINIHALDIWIDKILVLLYPYVLVFFGKNK